MEFSADHSSTDVFTVFLNKDDDDDDDDDDDVDDDDDDDDSIPGGGGGRGGRILTNIWAEVSCGEFETLNCSGPKIPKIHTLFRAKEKKHAVLI